MKMRFDTLEQDQSRLTNTEVSQIGIAVSIKEVVTGQIGYHSLWVTKQKLKKERRRRERTTYCQVLRLPPTQPVSSLDSAF